MYQRIKYYSALVLENNSLNHLIPSQKVNTQLSVGGVAEWLNAPVLKTDVGESLPWVRIPPPPPLRLNSYVNLEKTIFYWYVSGWIPEWTPGIKISRKFLEFRHKINQYLLGWDRAEISYFADG